MSDAFSHVASVHLYVLLNFNIFQALQRSTMYIKAQKVEIIICL